MTTFSQADLERIDEMLAKNITNEEIAAKLGMSLQTFKLRLAQAGFQISKRLVTGPHRRTMGEMAAEEDNRLDDESDRAPAKRPAGARG